MNLLSDSGWVSDADVGLLPVHVLLVRCSSAVAKSRLVQSLEVLVLVGDHVTNGVLPDGGHYNGSKRDIWFSHARSAKVHNCGGV
jgi:hypothetical protein